LHFHSAFDCHDNGNFFACQWGQVTGITYDGGPANSDALSFSPTHDSCTECWFSGYAA
jgi:hypothetical protein